MDIFSIAAIGIIGAVLAITIKYLKITPLPTLIEIDSSDLSVDSVALAEQVRTLDKTRLISYVGKINKESMAEVDKAIRISMGVD